MSCLGTPCAGTLPHSPLHPLLFPSASTDGIAGLEETWQGHAVWFWCQFQLCPGFYNQIKKQKAKKKKKRRRGRERRGSKIQLQAGKWHFNLSIDSVLLPLPCSPLLPPLFFPFLFLPYKLISPFIMWKDCRQGQPGYGLSPNKPAFCLAMSTKDVATKHQQSDGRNISLFSILRFQTVLEITHILPLALQRTYTHEK